MFLVVLGWWDRSIVGASFCKKNRWLCLCLRRFRHFSTSSVEFYEFHKRWQFGHHKSLLPIVFHSNFFGVKGSFQEETRWSWGITNRATCLAKQIFVGCFLELMMRSISLSIKGAPFLGRFGLDVFLNISLRLDLEPAMNGMECIFSGFCV